MTGFSAFRLRSGVLRDDEGKWTPFIEFDGESYALSDPMESEAAAEAQARAVCALIKDQLVQVGGGFFIDTPGAN